jgi:hypothetical protein
MHKSTLCYKIGKTELQRQLSTYTDSENMMYVLKYAHSVLRIISNFAITGRWLLTWPEIEFPYAYYTQPRYFMIVNINTFV